MLFAGVAAGVTYAVIGIGGMRHAMEQLFRRIETYSSSPIERELAQCEVQLARLNARLQELPDLIARGKRVMFQMQRSRRQVQTAVKSASFVFDIAKAVLSPRPPKRSS